MASRKPSSLRRGDMIVKVLIANDHGIAREGLRCLLERYADIGIVGAVANGREAAGEARRLSPQVVIMDISTPMLNGIEAIRFIVEANPGIGVIVVSGHDSAAIIQAALKSGARGYLVNESSTGDLVRAVRAVAAGQHYFSRGVTDVVCEALRGADPRGSPLETLSSTERDILRLVTEGKSNAEVAMALLLSPRTVEAYRSRIMRKLDVGNLPSLVKYAIRHGITSID
jgi:DNA-binding NarL/FixJ family response regulator